MSTVADRSAAPSMPDTRNEPAAPVPVTAASGSPTARDSSDAAAGPPPPSRSFLWCFHRFLDRYLPRNFHTLALLGGCPGDAAPDEPLIVALNHPSWWDPMLGLFVARHCFAERTFYAPIDAEALANYGMFRKLGFYGVRLDSLSGARQFLTDSRSLLARPGGSIWITPQGRFVDPRERTTLQPGLGHLCATLERGTVLPLAAEYPFWEERLPEALACFGEPIRIAEHSTLDKHEWTDLLSERLTAAQDRLAAASIAREADAFTPLLRGRADVGGFYDWGRRLKSWATLRRFEAAHSDKLND